MEGHEVKRSTSKGERLTLDECRGCGAVGLVERGAVPLCGRCLPNAYAIHLAEETIKSAQGDRK